MADPLDDVNEVLEELNSAAMHTSQGSFVRVEHVEKILKRRQEARAEKAIESVMEPPPKTLQEARRRAARDLKEAFPSTGPKEPGRAVEARQ